RYSHPAPGGHDGTLLTMDSALALDLVTRHEPRPRHSAAPFPRGHGLCSQRASRLHWEFLGLLSRSVPRLTLEDALAELADEAVRCAYSPSAVLCRDRPPARAARERRELAEAAKVVLSGQMDSPPTLLELAGRLGCSPFHLSRTFHATVGL